MKDLRCTMFTRDDLTEAGKSLPLDEITVQHLKMGTYQIMRNAELVIFTEDYSRGGQSKILKHRLGAQESITVSMDDYRELQHLKLLYQSDHVKSTFPAVGGNMDEVFAGLAYEKQP